MLTATDAKDIPKPVIMAFRTRVNQSKDTGELLHWIQDLNPGLHTEYWRVLDEQPEPKDQCLILLVDQDSSKAIKETSYRIFTGLEEGIFKVLNDSGEDVQRGKEAVADPLSLASGDKEGGTVIDTPSETLAAEHGRVVGVLGASEPTESETMDMGSLRETASVVEDIIVGEGVETDPP
jgi:hypothetical protein